MRWKDIDSDIKIGDIRDMKGFLILPMCVDGEWRWLERASWCERYDRDEGWQLLYWRN